MISNDNTDIKGIDIIKEKNHHTLKENRNLGCCYTTSENEAQKKNSTSLISISSDLRSFFKQNGCHNSSHHLFVKPCFPAEGKMLLLYLLLKLP